MRWWISTGTSSLFMGYKRKEPTSATTDVGRISRWWFRSGGSGECLKVVNQPGNYRSSDAAAKALKEVLPRVLRHFRNAIVRGDTDFDRSDVYNETIEAGAYFAIGGRLYPNRAALVEAIAEEDWKPFVPRADREEPSGPSRRVRTANYRRIESRGSRVSHVAYGEAVGE